MMLTLTRKFLVAWPDNCNRHPQHERGSRFYPFLSERKAHDDPSMVHACGRHLRALQTCYCSASCGYRRPSPLRETPD
ncbi:hypothetical protein JTE90_017854 [Oedothorax gibbosus]|uniref:Uncharacterized protein n=1 Tax=Oedothorax gibbosus TaxID=931172 RepID=A0AAV6TGQ1_9ARAC|nr:hypothetical protein JTE90_017854 [Oedothorax gibbosus]